MSLYTFSGLKRIKLDFINKISVAIDKVIKKIKNKKERQFFFTGKLLEASDSMSNFSSHWGPQNNKRKTLSWINI